MLLYPLIDFKTHKSRARRGFYVVILKKCDLKGRNRWGFWRPQYQPLSFAQETVLAQLSSTVTRLGCHWLTRTSSLLSSTLVESHFACLSWLISRRTNTRYSASTFRMWK